MVMISQVLLCVFNIMIVLPGARRRRRNRRRRRRKRRWGSGEAKDQSGDGGDKRARAQLCVDAGEASRPSLAPLVVAP